MKKKPFSKGWSFIIIFITVGLSYGIYHIYLYNAPRQSHYSRVSSSNLEQESLGNIQLLQSLESINRAKPRDDIERYQYYNLNNETTVATARGDDKIILISVYSDHTMRTARGIHVASSADDVIEAYGSSYYKRGEQGADIIGYVDKINHRSLEFWLQDHKVNMIRYSVDSVVM
ncbi:hypothetical protein [Paenibacillus sp.]|uniref:hypothetical protein n=1 Tax=Paenibacillus sp. TaxID=58172 RepID=UPI0028A632A1|nr:hypothetical protein [Paenibacillus sp.]